MNSCGKFGEGKQSLSLAVTLEKRLFRAATAVPEQVDAAKVGRPGPGAQLGQRELTAESIDASLKVLVRRVDKADGSDAFGAHLVGRVEPRDGYDLDAVVPDFDVAAAALDVARAAQEVRVLAVALQARGSLLPPGN